VSYFANDMTIVSEEWYFLRHYATNRTINWNLLMKELS